VSIIFGYYLSRSAVETSAGVSSLAFAFSIGSWLNLFILAITLSKKIKYSVENIISFTISVVALTVVALIIVQAVKAIVAGVVDIDYVRYLALQIALAGIAGIVSYLGLAWLLKFDEVRR
jgi:peptidoglycan biosynthesis protein MviN/MurJ (putative lipid II flippase)